MPSRPRLRSVVATTTATSHTMAAVMNRLVPFSTQPSAVGRAVVCRPATSEPPPGSVWAMTQIASPRAMAGSQRARCASVPCSRMSSPRMTARSWACATEAEACASSSWHSVQVSVSAPAPPYSAGSVSPSRPRSARRR